LRQKERTNALDGSFTMALPSSASLSAFFLTARDAGESDWKCRVASRARLAAPRRSAARESMASPPPFFISQSEARRDLLAGPHLFSFVSSLSALLFFLFFKQTKMSFAMTANFFYAVVVAGLAYNVFILYAGASAAKLALSK